MKSDQRFPDAVRRTRKILLPSLNRICEKAFSDITTLSPGQASWLRADNFPADEPAPAMADYVLAQSAELLSNASRQSGQPLHAYLEWFVRMLRDNSFAQQGRLRIEDIPKIIDDIILFDHVKKKARTTINKDILSYRSPNDLEDALQPLRETFTPRPAMVALDKDYLNGTDAEVVFASPTVRVVHLKTKQAAIAYGSSRWCTAYTIHKNYFSYYADDLLLLHTPDGERRQLHFRSGQFHDERDKPADLAVYVAAHPGLIEALAPYCARGARIMPYDGILEPLDIAKLIPFARSIPFSESFALERGMDFLIQISKVPAFLASLDNAPGWAAAADKLATTSAIHVSRDFLKIARMTTSWERFTEETDIGKWLHTAIAAHYDYLAESYLEHAREAPAWINQLSKAENLPKILSQLDKIGSDTLKIILIEGAMRVDAWQEHIPPHFIAKQLRESTLDGEQGVMRLYFGFIASQPKWQRQLVADGTIERIAFEVDRSAREPIKSQFRSELDSLLHPSDDAGGKRPLLRGPRSVPSTHQPRN